MFSRIGSGCGWMWSEILATMAFTMPHLAVPTFPMIGEDSANTLLETAAGAIIGSYFLSWPWQGHRQLPADETALYLCKVPT